ncbi:glycosyltransferase [Veronia pacifica]|uniref:Glycosyltransferase n=1 Tax=Veronia pacifica TaxID=1080227 RepID=A0A1C3ERV5_9GAMM|nr:glycosyltransferase [Veronia pacifica]
MYVISLKSSDSRRRLIKQQFEKTNTAFRFFDAIDGRESFPELASDYDMVRRLWLTSGKKPMPGEVGCYASHYSLWLKCVSEQRPLIVCEDDIHLHKDANEIIKKALNNVDRYGFLRLESIEPGGSSLVVHRENEFSFRLMHDNYGGLRAYAISPKAASQLIKHRWYFPVDCFVGANYIHNVDSFQMAPTLVVHHGDEITTIQEKKLQKTAWYRAPSREAYTIYKKIRLYLRYKYNCRKVIANQT